MPKKKNNFWLNLALVAGSVWLLAKFFETPKQAAIGGLRDAKRMLTNYVNADGVDEIEKDLNQYDRNEIGEIIRTFIDARLRDHLSMPFFKTLKGTRISGELRNNQWRVLLYVINNEEYLILNVFKKKSNETPQAELVKAERRLAEYLNRPGELHELT